MPGGRPPGIFHFSLANIQFSIPVRVLSAPPCASFPASSFWTAIPALADELPGHSAHGEAFNEGPRQAAVLIPGCGDAVKFPISSKKPEAQAFFTQGVGQLHGFWYYEAERSFRQVAAIDPDCAMAYWGMAMANVNNEKRAKAFIKKATPLKSKATPREQKWITVLENLYRDDDKRDKKQKSLDCIKDFEVLVQEDPRTSRPRPSSSGASGFLVPRPPSPACRPWMPCSIRFSPPFPIIPRITIAFICGIRANPSSHSNPTRNAVRQLLASPTCGTCPATRSPS
jgi:hypothetical protein